MLLHVIGIERTPILVVLAINDFITLFEDLAIACCGPATVRDVKLAVTRAVREYTHINAQEGHTPAKKQCEE
jgi:hypothetical protein